MKKNLSTILVSLGMFFVLDQTAWSLSYDEYKQALSTQCEMNKDWTKDAPVSGNFALPPEYPELTREAIEKSRENLLISSRSSGQNTQLSEDLEINALKSSLFPTLSLAKIMYTKEMNTVFGCAIIQSRENITKNLLSEIAKKFPNPNSEIQEKIRKEGEKLKIQKQMYNCLSISENQTHDVIKVIHAATRQYCHYDTYLRYIRKNLDSNITGFLKMEDSLWTESSEVEKIRDRELLSREIGVKNELIGVELIRAQGVLPRAVKAFEEMNRTYEIHLLLTIIYDDYLRLKKNLATYFNAVTQLMEKMQNAQLPNNK